MATRPAELLCLVAAVLLMLACQRSAADDDTEVGPSPTESPPTTAHYPLPTARCLSSDQRFLTGLRQRGLFQLAQTYCLDQLKDPRLPQAGRAELVIELSLSLADWAVNSAPDEREPLWERAQQVIDQFAGQYPDSPRLPLVRFQGALSLVARGELARQEAQLVVDGRPLLEEGRTYLRTAIRQLQHLAEEVQLELRRRSQPGRLDVGPANQDQLTELQLVSLLKNVQYQLARALRNQGQCYPADSPDRADALTQAASLLDPLARLDTTDPLVWKSRIDEIVCYRLLADYAGAARELEALLVQKPPPEITLRARAERIQLALATNQLQEAISLLSAGRQLNGVTSGQLDYAWLETYLEAWRVASRSKDSQNAAQWQTKATEMVRLIERLHGPYWTRRGEMLLASYVQTSPEGGDLQMRVRAAESYYRSGRFDDALEAYDRASRLARDRGDLARAFQLGYVAGAIEHQRQRHQEAMLRYRQLAMAMTDQPKAAEAHLLAIYHAQEIAKNETPQSLQQYLALLQEHLHTWDNAPSADQVRWRLGRLREHQRDWQNAIAAYGAIRAEYPEYVKVVEAAGRCYQAWLDQRRGAGQPTDQIAAAAAGWFESLTTVPQGHLPESCSPVAQAAALTAARLWLDYTTAGFARAERILSAALQRASDAPPQWKSTARAMLVFSLAGQGQRRQATDVLEQISAGPPDQLLAMLEGLCRIAANARPETRAELAEMQLRAVQLLDSQRGQLSESGQRTLDRLHAQALADIGRIDESLQAYQRLAKTYPRDPQIQEAYARLLLTRQDRGSLEAALAKWRELASKSPPGSDRWFRAKYEVAVLHYRLGNRQQTEKMIRLLQVLHPELGGPQMKAQFLQLLDRCVKR